MKKYLLFYLLIGGFFISFHVSAATVYQQLSDSSGSIDFNSSSVQLGSFISSSNGLIQNSELFLVIQNYGNISPSCINIFVSSTTQYLSYRDAQFVICFFSGTDDYFIATTTDYQPSNAVNWIQGQTYNVFTNANLRILTRANYSGHSFYGTISDASGSSVPVHPDIPGFTDVGIATTSQQQFCYSNFASSTGFLDSVGLSISQGICNVGVFLFVPSAASINQFSSLASTTATKIPFSYFYEIKNSIIGQSASSTTNLPTYTTDLAALGIGSTTALGNILPALTILSTSTVDTFLPSSVRTSLLFLARSAIWLGLGFTLYRIALREVKPKTV